MSENIVQLSIMIFGGIAIYLISLKRKCRRWGYIFGLISQPFWIYTTFKNNQYGMFILSLWYTYSWINGIYNFWINKGE